MLDSPVTSAPVRIAGPGDENKIFEAGLLMHAETALYSLSEQKIREGIRLGTQRKGGIIGIIDAPDGSIAAMIGLIITSAWYTTDIHLEDFWTFVRRDYRRSGAANMLVHFSIKMSDELGIPLQLGVTSIDRLEAKTRLMRRKMKQIGALFAHNLNIGKVS